MLKLAAAITLVLTISTATTTAGGHYEEGVSSYTNGHYSQAVGHYRQAAMRGSTFAQHNLASMYFMGQGVTENPIMAYMWEQLAIQSGFSSGKGFLDVYSFQLSSEEIKTANLRANVCAQSLYRDCEVPTIQ
jgi:TPR repeat protein